MVLHYTKMGSGYPLIILHGLYGSGDNWISIARALQKYFTIYLIDQRNHGLSPHSHEHNYEVLTNDLSDFIQQHRLDKVCIIGHSMGGKVSMNYALQYPEKVLKLVIVDIALRSYVNDLESSPQIAIHKKIMSALSALDLEFAESREEIDKQLARYLPQKAIRLFLLKNVRRDKNRNFYWSLNIEALKNNSLQIIDKIGTNGRIFPGPVLVVSGKNSGYINKNDHDDFRKAFLNVSIDEMNAGHWIHAEQPKTLIKKLLEFLPVN